MNGTQDAGTAAAEVGTPQALRATRAEVIRLQADRAEAKVRLLKARQELRLHERWNVVRRALLAEQFCDSGWAAVARLNEHVNGLAGVLDEQGLPPVAGHCTKEAATLLGSPHTIRIGHDEFLVLDFDGEAHAVPGDTFDDRTPHDLLPVVQGPRSVAEEVAP